MVPEIINNNPVINYELMQNLVSLFLQPSIIDKYIVCVNANF